MSLRTQIRWTAIFIRVSFASSLMLTTIRTSEPWLGVLLGVWWLIGCGPLLRHVILPLMFPDTTCPGCRRTVPLVGRFKCGGHYTDHRERHILTFHCSQGHVLDGFDCPRCHSTILVQRADPKILRHGSALRLRTTSNLSGKKGLLLGQDECRRAVYLPDDKLAWHVAITGGTGRGKSTLLANLAKQLIERGSGFTLLDPGGDLAKLVVQQVPPEREADVLYLDVGNRQHPFALNVLHARTDLERAVLTEELLGVFQKLHGSAWGPLLAHQLRMALRAVMACGGTLRDVYQLFTNDAARSRLVRKLKDPDLRAFWRDELPTIPAMRRSAVTNKLSPIVFHPVLGPIISAAGCNLDADKAIRERQIVVVNLASGSPGADVTTLLGTFLVQKVIAAAFRQGSVPAEHRVRHVLIVDEFQRFMHRAAAFDQILAEARKYKLSLIVANQFVEQLAPSVRAALFGNVGCLAAFRVGHRDARVLTPEFSGAIADDLLELGLGQCLVRIGSDWTTVRTPRPPRGQEDDPMSRIVARMQQRIPHAEKPAVGPAWDDGGADEPEFVV